MTICGEVIKIKGKTAVIKTARPASCEACSNAGLCNKKELQIEVNNNLNANIGNIVEVEMPEDKKAMGLLCYIFIIPVIILILSAWLFTLNTWYALVSIPLIIIYILLLRKFDRSHKNTNHINKIIEDKGERFFNE